MDRTGDASMPEPFTFDPRLTGSAHGLSSEARRDTQMSAPPSPPARVDTKYRLSSSGENAAFISLADELMGAPRFTGSDHSELAKDMASILDTRDSGTSVGLSQLSAARAAESQSRCLWIIRPPLVVQFSSSSLSSRQSAPRQPA